MQDSRKLEKQRKGQSGYYILIQYNKLEHKQKLERI